MLRVFGHHIAMPAIILAVVEIALVLSFLHMGEAALRVWYPAQASAPGVPDAGLFAAVGVTAFVAIAAVGLYRREMFGDLRTTIRRSLISLPLIVGASLLVVYAWAALEGAPAASQAGVVAAAVPAAVLAALALRAALRQAVGGALFRRRVIIVGTGPQAARLAGLARSERPGFTVAGFVDLAGDGSGSVPRDMAAVLPRATLEDRGQLKQFVRGHKVEEIVVACHERRRGNGAAFGLPMWDLLDCRLAGTRVTTFSDFWERETGKIDLETLRPGWLVFSEGFRYSALRAAMKRTFDILASLGLLIVTLPITLLTVLLVRLTSPGPVFYRQERVGLNGRTFMLMKFRSMRADAEKDGKARWAQKNDVRVTPVGRFIRLTRIDEIPQVLNVLKGDMSFIGPRPERPQFVDELAAQIPYYGERHAVRPGISGWAQINYPYGASLEDAREKLAYDLYYVKNSSTFLDLVILVQTVKVVLFPEGVH